MPRKITTHGLIEGYYLKHNGQIFEVYEAVPYAQPPVADLRFKSPLPLTPWDDIKNCGKGQRKHCVDFRFNLNKNQGLEDCLYMDIILPAEQDQSTNSSALPILIWIQGISYQIHSKDEYSFASIAENFAAYSIIFISINYRLGPLGFLSGGHRDLPGNFGLDDQIEALRWIKNNAKNFHGDPDNIVLAGESCGASSASLLSVSPKTFGLFSAAVLRSGSGLAPWAVRSTSTENNSARFIDYLGCTYNHTLGMSHIIDCLQQLNITKLFEGWLYIAQTSSKVESHLLGHTYFTPTIDLYRIDESIIPCEPTVLIQKNARIPIMIGVTNTESAFLLKNNPEGNRLSSNDEWNLNQVISPNLYANYRHIQKAIEFHYMSNNQYFDETDHLLTKIVTDENFKAPAAREAMFYASKNLTVYAYSFQYVSDSLNSHSTKAHHQVAHGDDSMYLFHATKFLQWSESDRNVAKRLSHQIVNFLHVRSTGEPQALPYTLLHKVATSITGPSSDEQIDFYTDVSYFWYETIPTIEMLNLEPQYRVLLQPCTMCEYPYKIPFYIILILLIFVTICSLMPFIRRQRIRHNSKYTLNNGMPPPSDENL
ncbi:unnamed protein product [Dracunculus medinensis]|uniref:COesterase domain-containing protein n=1 Tax=Dracunculus medinensis TaxID=318479 RepID=A0A0N4UKX1_DRAME|nr:unnamed protein product [Dracunculus medinensis]